MKTSMTVERGRWWTGTMVPPLVWLALMVSVMAANTQPTAPVSRKLNQDDWNRRQQVDSATNGNDVAAYGKSVRAGDGDRFVAGVAFEDSVLGRRKEVWTVQRHGMKYPLIRLVDETNDRPLSPGVKVSSGKRLQTQEMVADHLSVRFRSGARRYTSGTTVVANGSEACRVRAVLPSSGLVLVEFDGVDPLALDRVKRILETNPDVISVAPDYVVHTTVMPNDKRFGELWGMHNTGQYVVVTNGVPDADIGAPEAWDLATGSADVVVGVVDTGIDYYHPDLVANLWVNKGEIPGNGIDDDANGYIDDVYGINAITGTGNPLDDNFHGTHCAGTIGAVGNNGIGVAGVCWSVKVMALKFLDYTGNGYISDATEAFAYARTMKARGVNVRVLSNSWGGGGYDTDFKRELDACVSAGILVVAAASNGGSDGIGDDNDKTAVYPASYVSDGLIAVAATDCRDRLAVFSNYGATSVHLGAPGVNILSTFPTSWTPGLEYYKTTQGRTFTTNYECISGTSMATPHVAGAAALTFSLSPTVSVATVRNAILGSVDPLVDLTGKTVTGGRLNVAKALGVMTLSIADQKIDDDATGGTVGNGDGVISAGETFDLFVQLMQNATDALSNVSAQLTLRANDANVTILQDTVVFGNLPRGSLSWGNGAFRVKVQAGIVTPHPIGFALMVRDATGGTRRFELDDHRYTVYVASTVSGKVIDVIDGTSLAGVNINAYCPQTGTTRSTISKSDGTYLLSTLIDGSYTLTAVGNRYKELTTSFTVPPSRANLDLALQFSKLEVAPTSLSVNASLGQTVARTLTLTNRGLAGLSWNVTQESTSMVQTANAGDVLRRFSTRFLSDAYGCRHVYGCAYVDGALWVGGNVPGGTQYGGVSTLFKLNPVDGSLIEKWDISPWVQFINGLEWDGQYLWVNDWYHVGGRVVKLDLKERKCLKTFDNVAEQYSDGVAVGDGVLYVSVQKYDQSVRTDSGTVYMYDANTGERLGSWKYPDVVGIDTMSITYHDNALWATRTWWWGEEDGQPSGQDIYKLNPKNGELLALYKGPGDCLYEMAFDDDGNVWIVRNHHADIYDTNPWEMVLVENWEGTWLKIDPMTGTIPGLKSQAVGITLNASKAGVGTHKRNVVFYSNGSDTPNVTVPLTFAVDNGSGSSIPVASAESYVAVSGRTMTVPSPGVLANDSDPNGDALQTRLLKGVDHGSLTLNSDGALTYVPAGDYLGLDNFRYSATDGVYDSDPVTVTIAVGLVGTTNLALLKPATASAPFPTFKPEWGNDGDLSTFHYGNGGSADYWQVDLGTAERISLVEVVGLQRDYDLPDERKNYCVLGSLDGAAGTWTVVADQGSTPFPYKGSWKGTVNDGRRFRFLRVKRTDAMSGMFAEFRAFGVQTVIPNRPPVATDDFVATPQDKGFAINVLANDYDPDSDALTIMSVSQGQLGKTSIQAFWIQYLPNPGVSGSDKFQYVICDTRGLTATGTVHVTITPTGNQPPVCSITSPLTGATFTAPATIAITANASDSDGTVTKVEFFQGATKLGEDTTSPYEYVWSGVAAGSYTLTVKATDNAGAVTTSAGVNVTVTGGGSTNRAPVAANVSVTTTEDTAKTVAMSASDPDGDSLTYTIVTGPAHGSFGAVSGSNVVYTPAANYNGSDSFTFKANDGKTNSAPATVSITVTAVNDAPTCSITSPANGATFTAGTNITIQANASDVDGTIAKVEFFNGATKLGEDTTSPYAYTWSGVAAGSYTLTVKATDNSGAVTTSAGVNVTVNPAGSDPSLVLHLKLDETNGTMAADSSGAGHNGSLSNGASWVSGKLGGGVKFDGVDDVIRADLVSAKASEVSFAFWARIDATNDPRGGLFFNGSGANGFGLSAGSQDGKDQTSMQFLAQWKYWHNTGVKWTVGQWQHWAVTIAAQNGNTVWRLYRDGVLAYTSPELAIPVLPTLNTTIGAETASGASTIPCTLDDVRFYERVLNAAEVAALANPGAPANNPPVANAQSVTTAEDTAKAIVLTGSDPDSDPLTFAVVTQPAHGTLSGAAPNVTYTPAANYNGADSFTFKANDGKTNSAPATVSITVTAVNDQPVIASCTATPSSGTAPLAVAFAASATDVDGDPLTYAWAFGDGANGSGANVSHTYASTGTFAATLTVSDGKGGTATASKTITANPASGPDWGLLAEFFDYTTSLSVLPDLSGRAADVSRVDQQVNYPSTSDAWTGLPANMVDTFASRHTGFLIVPAAGSYTLYLNSDDGSKLWVDGTLAIDNDGLHGMVEKSVTLTLSAGEHQIRIEFFENGGGAGLVFSWAGPGITKQVVPASALRQPRVNQPPVALAGVDPINGTTLDEYYFWGTDSYDPDGKVNSYQWTVNSEEVSTQVEFLYSFPTTGVYNVTLTVWDNKGASDSDLVQVQVTEPAVTVNVEVPDGMAGEPGLAEGTGTIRVRRTGSTSAALTVNVALSGDASNGVDYAAVAGTVVIPAGAIYRDVTISPLADASDEPDEMVILTVLSGTGYTVDSGASAGLVLIKDQTYGTPVVSAEATDALAKEPMQTTDKGAIKVNRTGSCNAALTVYCTLGGTAVNGTDYSTVTVPVVLAVGQSSKVLTIAPLADGVVESNETVVLTLTANAAYQIAAGKGTATVTIQDATVLTTPVVSVVATDADAQEPAGGVLNYGYIRFARTTRFHETLTVNCTVGGTASNGVDYVMVTVPIVFAVGEGIKDISVRPIADVVAEGVETAIFTLTVGTGTPLMLRSRR